MGSDVLDPIDAVPGVEKPDPILHGADVRRAFGGLVAVDVARLEVQRNSITALIGPNGAGKTTLFNLLTGFDRGGTGSIRFDGDQVPRRTRPEALATQGMVRTFQLTKALSRLTVFDNMRLGAVGQMGERFGRALFKPLWADQEADVTQRAEALLKRFQLYEKREDLAGTLSGGQRKLLEMARALMTDPKLVMLDEPTAGVNPALTQSLLQHVKDLRDEGMTVLFVEHDMDVVMDISDWVVVMAEGAIIAESLPEDIGTNKAVVDAYLGAHHGAPLELDRPPEEADRHEDEGDMPVDESVRPDGDAQGTEGEGGRPEDGGAG